MTDQPPISVRRVPNFDRNPWAIARDPALTPVAKLSLLRQLELDARQGLVASEEGMVGPTPPVSLTQILAAIAQVEPEATARLSPTKI